MESQIKAELRSTLLMHVPKCECRYAIGCTMCEDKACCSLGVECEHPKHPQRTYGRSALIENFCPNCSYVITFLNRPDLGRPLWCKKCVENPLEDSSDESA